MIEFFGEVKAGKHPFKTMLGIGILATLGSSPYFGLEMTNKILSALIVMILPADFLDFQYYNNTQNQITPRPKK